MTRARLVLPLLVWPARVAALSLCIAALSLSAAAQPATDFSRELGELSISQLLELEVDSVYGASRYVQKAVRAPSSISVVTAQDIRRFGARTLGDVLSSVRGLYVTNDRNYLYLGIRGFQRPNDYNTRMLVLIDGHRMNDNIYGLGSVGRDAMVDVDLIDRIEVIRGPSSSIYGSSAFFGVINVITRRGESFDGSEASAEAGSFGSVKSRITFGTTFDNGLEWLVSGSRYASSGRRRLYFSEFDQRTSEDPRAANNGIAENLDGEDVGNFFSRAQFNDFTVSAFWNGRIKQVPTASFGTVFNESRAETQDYRRYIDVRYDRRLTESLSLQARVFYDDYEYTGVYPYDVAESGFDPEISIFKDEALGQWVGTEVQLTAAVAERHTIIVGGEYRDNIREYQTGFYETEPRRYILTEDRSSESLGIFAQSETQISSNLLLTAGVRYDSYSGDLDALNPRLALIYSPSTTGTLKALYGEAFRAPNPYEAYYFVAQGTRPLLDPETIDTYELVYEKELGNQYRLTVTGYYYEATDLISQTSTADGLIYFDNIDGARAKGLEIEAERRYDSGALVRASYTVQKAVNMQTHEDLSSSPRHMAKLNLGLPLHGERLSVGLELQYHGTATTLLGNRTDDFLTTNFTLLRRPVVRGLEWSGTIYNVFDRLYAYPGAEDHLQDVIEQEGRAFQGKLTYRF